MVFPDHVLTGSLGYGSMIDMPAFPSGHLLGTVKILFAPAHYAAEKVQKMEDFRPAAMLAFNSLVLAKKRPEPGNG